MSSVALNSHQHCNSIYSRELHLSQINIFMLQRIKKWFTIDHVVDLTVDILLMVWDVISSPVLIVVRILRHFIGEYFTDKIKRGIRWIAHWFQRKRAYRLEHGHGIFRTYWWLIIGSPLLFIGIIIIVGVFAGFATILDWFVEELEIEFGNGDEDL